MLINKDLRFPTTRVFSRKYPDFAKVGHFWVSQVSFRDFSEHFGLYHLCLLDIIALNAQVIRLCGPDGDVHDAWSQWMVKRDKTHESLVPYEDLAPEVRDQDGIFTSAIRQAAQELGQETVPLPLFEKVLFPSGPPDNADATQQTLDLYKIMVSSSESLVNRRQAVNTFFLTINGALLTAFGLIVKSSGADKLSALGISILAIAGAILCGAWRSLITSFGQLNRGKFQVINTIERYLKTAIYAAEWEALGRGEDPKIYRSFTSREIWVPNALFALHILSAIVAILVALGCITFGV